jgi:6-phosphogluconolactonase
VRGVVVTAPRLEVLADAAAVAQRGARLLADWLKEAVERHGDAMFAVSGGRSPWPLFELLVQDTTVPWSKVHLVQVDERILPDGHEERNWTRTAQCFVNAGPIPKAHAHPMPVTADDLEAATDEYAELLGTICPKSTIDALHLGLGDDGHTASLAPGDRVCDIMDRDVALTEGLYKGTRRMTLTRPCLNRAAHMLFQVTGEAKRCAVKQLLAGDTSIPAGLLNCSRAVVVADTAAGTA